LSDATALALPPRRRDEDPKAPRRPPVPADADLRHFRKVPILAQRLFDSRFNKIATDAEFRAGLNLWLKSWFQVPAGSLPLDDVELVGLSGYGENMEGWLFVKATALHGWFLGTDGRLYNKTVAEVVNEALKKSRKQSENAKSGWEKRRANQPVEKKIKAAFTKKKRKDAMAKKSTDATAMPRREGNRTEGNREDLSISTSSGSSTTVSESASESSEPTAKVIMRYPCVVHEDGDALPAFFDITQERIDTWKRTYPKVDVDQVLRELHLWAEDNPAKRKTPRHAPSHIADCLQRRQRTAELEPYRSTNATALVKPDYTAGTQSNRRSFLDVDD
jgi:hypothetical protein